MTASETRSIGTTEALHSRGIFHSVVVVVADAVTVVRLVVVVIVQVLEKE